MCTDTWVLADGPMPPETDAVLIELDGSEKLGKRGTARPARCPPWARQLAMCVGYGLLLGGALMHHNRERG